VITLVLALELVALASTGSSGSPLAPLLMVPPLLGALAFASASEAYLWFGGTSLVMFVAAIYELTQPPMAIATGPLAATTALAAVLGHTGSMHLRRRLEAARRRARDANEEAIAAVGALHQHQLATAASFAHELKNPLAAMQGLATLVRRRAAREPELAADLDAIVADVHGMSAAVTGLLDFSRAIHPDNLQRVALRPLIARLAAAAGRGTLELHVSDDLSLLAEPRKLERVLRTLLGPEAVAIGGEVVGTEVRLEVVLARPIIDSDATAIAAALAAQQGGELHLGASSLTLRMPRHEAT